MENNSAQTNAQSDFDTLPNHPMWESMLHYYRKHGLGAWSQKVPFQITNNPTIYKETAKLVFLFCAEHSRTIPHQRFTIVELGVGLGKFTIGFTKHLLHLMHQSNQFFNIEYIITDGSNDVLIQLQNHPQLPKSKHIDYKFQSITILPNQPLPEALTTSKNTIIIAHYFFDSLYQSAFHLQNNTLKQVHFDRNNTEKAQKSLKTNIDAHLYYQNPLHNEILKAIGKKNSTQQFLMPDCAFVILEQLLKNSTNHLLLIADKGYSNTHQSSYSKHFEIIDDGAFSAHINIDAIDQFMQKKYNAEAFITPSIDKNQNLQLAQGIWLSGSEVKQHIITKLQAQSMIEKNMESIYTMALKTRNMIKNFHECKAFLKMNDHNMYHFLNIIKSNPHLKIPTIHTHIDDLTIMVEQWVFSPIKEDQILWWECCRWLIIQTVTNEKIEYLIKKMIASYNDYYGTDYFFYMMNALFMQKQQNNDEAKKYFLKAKTLNPNCKYVNNALKASTI